MYYTLYYCSRFQSLLGEKVRFLRFLNGSDFGSSFFNIIGSVRFYACCVFCWLMFIATLLCASQCEQFI